MGFRVRVPSVFGEFYLPDIAKPHAGDSIGEWSSPCFLYGLIDIRGGARCQVHDGMQLLDFSLVFVDVILEYPVFSVGSPIFSSWDFFVKVWGVTFFASSRSIVTRGSVWDPSGGWDFGSGFVGPSFGLIPAREYLTVFASCCRIVVGSIVI